MEYESDIERGITIPDRLVFEGGKTKFLNSIIRIGDELSKEDFSMRVKGFDDNLSQTSDIGLQTGMSVEMES